jgi:hypothetical protein
VLIQDRGEPMVAYLLRRQALADRIATDAARRAMKDRLPVLALECIQFAVSQEYVDVDA